MVGITRGATEDPVERRRGTETRIAAAELAIAQVAERAAAVRDILSRLVESEMQLAFSKQALREALERVLEGERLDLDDLTDRLIEELAKSREVAPEDEVRTGRDDDLNRDD